MRYEDHKLVQLFNVHAVSKCIVHCEVLVCTFATIGYEGKVMKFMFK
jgi:hypothetical protein